MNKYLVLLGLLALTTWVKAQEVGLEYKKFYYPNGQISSEGGFIDQKPEGYWKTYYENGILKSEGNRLDFLLDSAWRFYDETGVLQLVIHYKEGKKHGERISYLPDEIIYENFVEDVKEGYTIHTDTLGRIMRKIPFISGLEDGVSMVYDSTATIIELITFKKGYITAREKINRHDSENKPHGPWKWFYDTGQLKADGYYKNGMKNGIFRQYDVEGNLQKIEKYIDDLKQDTAEEITRLETRRDYYPDGKVKIEATYRNNIAEGIRREFDESGTVVASYIFRDGNIVGEGIIDTDGLRQGYWQERYPNGVVKAAGNYTEGKRTGDWEFYYLDGKIEQTGHYDEQGLAQGKWKWYYQSGNIWREENYRHGMRDGLMTEFDQDGKVIAQGDFIDDKEEGFWRLINDDFIEEGNFNEGLAHGLWKHFYADGSVAFEGSFIDGQPNGKHIHYFLNGKKSEEGTYLMGRKNGEWKKWYDDGTLLLVIQFVNGIEQSYDGIPIAVEDLIMDDE
ncbi:MAG: hypothetical protein WCR58_07130 [Bacteroidales bacterium]|nr:hypothetical protein [Bacteroidales bacterium]MDD3702042.1 hypothetical protein [Bacteroidales bacterium]MDY0369711.1 hypothetical protein [Bacteroidales bacterium]